MYKFKENTSEFKNVNINLRHESEILTKEFGINVLYIRNCKFVRCKCFDDLNKTGNTNCKLCMGSGYFASIEKVKAIESSSFAYSKLNSIKQLPIGMTNQKEEIYYIRHQFTPKERDFILKVTWDKNEKPVDVIKVLEIINVYEMRGNNGRVELNGCLVNDRTDMVKQFSEMLKSLPEKITVPLLKGEKTIWPSKLISK